MSSKESESHNVSTNNKYLPYKANYYSYSNGSKEI